MSTAAIEPCRFQFPSRGGVRITRERQRSLAAGVSQTVKSNKTCLPTDLNK
jgi:hypothetical protein